MREMTPLCDLARKYGTDKGGRHYIAGETCHEYTPLYWDILQGRRDSVRDVLEIGVNHGCSVRMWEEFFPNARIYGFDSDANALVHNSDRIRCIAADQGNRESLLHAVAEIGPDPRFDLIVDDGSHERGHQILSAQVLLPFLLYGGLYIVEDLYPDCEPELVGDPVIQAQPGFRWVAPETEWGMGKAHCGCGCGRPERLLIFGHG